MAQLTGPKVVSALRGLLSSLDSTDDELVKNLLVREKVGAYVTDGGTAGTAQTETFIWRNDTGVDMYVSSARVTVPVAVTANDTTYATFTLAKRDTAGANSATVGTCNTKTSGAGGTGNLTAFLPQALTLTAANRVVPAGYVLTIAVAKASTGVAIAASTSQARVEVVVEPAG